VVIRIPVLDEKTLALLMGFDLGNQAGAVELVPFVKN
jgi:hypothetical protein